MILILSLVSLLAYTSAQELNGGVNVEVPVSPVYPIIPNSPNNQNVPNYPNVANSPLDPHTPNSPIKPIVPNLEEDLAAKPPQIPEQDVTIEQLTSPKPSSQSIKLQKEEMETQQMVAELYRMMGMARMNGGLLKDDDVEKKAKKLRKKICKEMKKSIKRL